MRNYKLFFIASVAFAVMVAALAAYGYNSVAGMVPVVISSTSIAPDEMVTGKNVMPGRTPRGALKMDTIRDSRQLAGMTAKGYIPQGTVLRESMFQPISNAGVPAKLSLLNGRVAVAVPADIYTTVGNSLKEKNTVSVRASKEGITRELIKKATVLAIPKKGGVKGAVVLAVTPDEADAILSAQSAGESLAMHLNPSTEEG
ncbi:MAG: hypothetical protein FH756_10905 [Firmicutes bacterium]|nr:hypothetical protein [Bacillota bacterium]